MASDSTVKIKFIGDAKDLEKSLDGLDKNLFSVSQSANKTGIGMKGLAKGLGVAGGVLAGGAALGVKIFELGKNLDVLKKKAATVFEDSLPSVHKWATETATAMGLTKNEATGLAANFADLLKPMGFTAAQAADMSTKVVGLSGALAAWSGGTRSAAEVSDILAKAMLGERDALKGLGISITEADVSARLLKNGTNELTGAALEQAKAIATSELIFEKSKDAQDAWNAKQFEGVDVSNRLKVKFKELQEHLAEKLYPILLDLGMWIVDKGIPAMEDAAAKVQEWWAKQEGLKDAIAGVIEFIKIEVEGIKILVGWIQGLSDAITAIQNKWGKQDFQTTLNRIAGISPTVTVGGERFSTDAAPVVVGGERFGGGRASGGPVGAGMSYTVGEHGPETLHMGRNSGRISPNGGGMAQVINLNIDGRSFMSWLADYSRDAGGIPVTLRSPS